MTCGSFVIGESHWNGSPLPASYPSPETSKLSGACFFHEWQKHKKARATNQANFKHLLEPWMLTYHLLKQVVWPISSLKCREVHFHMERWRRGRKMNVFKQ